MINQPVDNLTGKFNQLVDHLPSSPTLLLIVISDNQQIIYLHPLLTLHLMKTSISQQTWLTA
jgi:hypothetical protein